MPRAFISTRALFFAKYKRADYMQLQIYIDIYFHIFTFYHTLTIYSVRRVRRRRRQDRLKARARFEKVTLNILQSSRLFSNRPCLLLYTNVYIFYLPPQPPPPRCVVVMCVVYALRK